VLLVCSWLGKSPRIAQRSYFLVTEDDFADGCDFYGDIGPNLATYFHDSISADIDSLLLCAGVHAPALFGQARSHFITHKLILLSNR
jgi:hypothetical protein